MDSFPARIIELYIFFDARLYAEPCGCEISVPPIGVDSFGFGFVESAEDCDGRDVGRGRGGVRCMNWAGQKGRDWMERLYHYGDAFLS